jgi:hypothetical protein
MRIVPEKPDKKQQRHSLPHEREELLESVEDHQRDDESPEDHSSEAESHARPFSSARKDAS